MDTQMMLTLTSDEVTPLTGYKRACEQRRFLQAAGVQYRLNKQNRPVVSGKLTYRHQKEHHENT
jgi:hypothetical protein